MALSDESQLSKDADRLALVANWIREHLQHVNAKLRPWHISRIGLSVNQLTDDEVRSFLGISKGKRAHVSPRMTPEEVDVLAERMKRLYRDQN
jgi:hypothetical protein